ncbi:hypothetical protein VPH35_072944 [Triticum aestivum]
MCQLARPLAPTAAVPPLPSPPMSPCSFVEPASLLTFFARRGRDAHCIFAILLTSGTHTASSPSSSRRGRCRRRRSSARPEMLRLPFSSAQPGTTQAPTPPSPAASVQRRDL